jgi:hypothetical protein
VNHSLPPSLREVFASLLAASEQTRVVELDAVGEALGVLAVSYDEIDALISALEAAGRSVQGPLGGGTEGRLKRVVEASRALSQENGRRPTLREVALRADLSEEQVRHALALLRVMQR